MACRVVVVSACAAQVRMLLLLPALVDKRGETVSTITHGCSPNADECKNSIFILSPVPLDGVVIQDISAPAVSLTRTMIHLQGSRT